MDIRKKKFARKIFVGFLVFTWVGTLGAYLQLSAHVRTLQQLVDLQSRWCDGVGKVNQVCEATLVDLGSRLGLDQDYLPLVTTALWRRTMGTVTVARARRSLEVPATGKRPLDDPKAAMGGPVESLKVRK